MSLLLNTQSRFVIAFLPKGNHPLISWLQSLSAMILEPKKIKSVTIIIVFPSICHEVMGPDALILIFFHFEFQDGVFCFLFSFSHFNFIKEYFSYSSLSAIRVISYTYLRLLIFLLAILIPVCDSSSSEFHMIYSV